MTENEAKVFIENAKEQSKSMLAELLVISPKVFAVKEKDFGEYYSNLENCKKEIEACEVAVKALEEIQQYKVLESRLSDMFGGKLPLFKYVDELEIALKEPENQHPVNAKILTYSEAEMWEAYRKIGTVDEIKQKLEELERWHTTEINPAIKNVFANLSTQICHNCDHKDEYIEELETEIEQYRAIGTVKECMSAMEKQKKELK